MKQYDVIIIGAGPAGLTAGIYALRGGLSALIVERDAPGGQILKTHDIENFPGFENIAGYELAIKMHEQTVKAGCEFMYDEVETVDLTGGVKRLKLKSGEEAASNNVIIATGAKPMLLNVKGEAEFTGRGVSYCATCDGNFYRGKTVVTVGGGNTAVYDALFLSNIVNKVYVVHRRKEFRAEKVLVDALRGKDNVEFVLDSVIDEIYGENKVDSVRIKSVIDGSEQRIFTDGVFIAIGQKPQSELFMDVAKDEHGFIITDTDMKTSVNGVYAIGDVRSTDLRQIVTACADGAVAASAIIKNRA